MAWKGVHLTKPRLQVTDRQYARMKLLLGEASFSEKKAPHQLVLL